jgi:YD repeat-containing protein
MYDGNNVQTEYTTYDAKKKHKKESYNFMGWLTSVVDNGGERIKYEYYSNGKIKSAQIGENGNSRILLAYDGRGNKTLVHDPNYGQMSYKYDALGNIRRISNAQYVVDMEYDVLGRMMQRTENNLQHKTMRVVRWEYSCDKGYDGLLSRVSSSGGHHIEYGYDDKFRLAHTMESINGKSFKTTYSYDAANRVETITYPSGFCVLKRYSNAGYEKMVCDAKTDLVLWRTEDVDSKGHITEFQLGNGIKTKCSYNAYHGAVENIETKMSDVVYQNMSYNYDGVGNLIYRCDAYNNYEEFEYDSYDRLDEIILNGEVNGRVSYRENNIRDKEVNGVKVLYNTVYSKNKLNAIVSAKSDDERIYERFNQKIEYSTFDNVIAVKDEDKTLSIGYGVDNERIFMQYNIGDKMMRKRYAGDCEYIEEDGKTKVLTYIEGPMGVFAVHVDDGEEQIHYIHKDNLGSWNVITNESGEVLQEMSFDAWGNLRNPQNWREGIDDMPILHDRGLLDMNIYGNLVL